MQDQNPFTREYFEELFAENPDPWDFENGEYEQAKYQHTLAELPLARFRRVLEVGCANGALTVKLGRRCDRLVAVDVAESALERARARCAEQPHIEFHNMRMPSETPDGPFDLVLLSEVACYWDDADLAGIADFLRRVVEPNGYVLLVHYTGETGYPKSGDEAVETLRRLAGANFKSVKAQRHDGYRLDLWQRAADSASLPADRHETRDTMPYLKLPLDNPTSLQNALETWQGFVELYPGEPTIGPNRVYELDDRSDGTWSYDFHWKRPAEKIDAIGCNFIQNIELWAPSIAVHAGQLVGYGAWTDQDNWRVLPTLKEDGFFDCPTPTDRAIDRPVLIADGHNYSTWGHWIIDYLPRFAIARELLGDLFDQLSVPLPFNIPSWVIDLLESTCSVRPSNVIRYQPYAERLICARAVVPSYCYSGIHTFHSFLRQFYHRSRPAIAGPPVKLCISREGIVPTGSIRRFPLRERFEEMAADRGYRIIRPQTLSVSDQIELFANAPVIIGEHGSAMHNAVFSAPGTIVGCIGFWNAVQLQIGYVCEHRNVYLTRGCTWPSEEQPYFQIDVTEQDLVSFFDKIDELSPASAVPSRVGSQNILEFDSTADFVDLPKLAADNVEGIAYEKLADQIVAVPTPPAFTFGPIDRGFGQFYYGQRLCREVGLYRIYRGCVIGDGLIARQRSLLRCVELGLHEESIPRLLLPFENRGLKLRQEAGPLVAIAGPVHEIYGHWLIDHLPKLWVLDQCGIDLESIRFLLPDSLKPFAKTWLDLLGIRDEQLVYYDPQAEAVEVEELILPTAMRFESVASPLLREAADMLLDRVTAKGGLPSHDQGGLPDRLYISRSHIYAIYRPLRNREAIEAQAVAAGFTIVKPEELPIAEQIALFRGAKQIVGEYGSALHNSLFSRPGTVMAALRGSTREPWYLQSGIGRVLDQPTGYVFGRTDPEDRTMGYTIDEDDFDDCLRLILRP